MNPELNKELIASNFEGALFSTHNVINDHEAPHWYHQIKLRYSRQVYISEYPEAIDNERFYCSFFKNSIDEHWICSTTEEIINNIKKHT